MRTYNKNHNSLESFVSYCNAHPEERFWQALRNWSGHGFILSAAEFEGERNGIAYYRDLRDTFGREDEPPTETATKPELVAEMQALKVELHKFASELGTSSRHCKRHYTRRP